MANSNSITTALLRSELAPTFFNSVVEENVIVQGLSVFIDIVPNKGEAPPTYFDRYEVLPWDLVIERT